jgi:hypothetical protein
MHGCHIAGVMSPSFMPWLVNEFLVEIFYSLLYISFVCYAQVVKH